MTQIKCVGRASRPAADRRPVNNQTKGHARVACLAACDAFYGRHALSAADFRGKMSFCHCVSLESDGAVPDGNSRSRGAL